MKLQNEGRKIMHLPELKVSCTCVRVPVVRSHSVSIVVRTKEKISVERARELIAAWRLDGVEIDHPRNSPEDKTELLRLAKENGLLITGGTDYHGIHTVTPRPVGAFTTHDEQIARLNDLAKARKSTFKRTT